MNDSHASRCACSELKSSVLAALRFATDEGSILSDTPGIECHRAHDRNFHAPTRIGLRYKFRSRVSTSTLRNHHEQIPRGSVLDTVRWAAGIFDAVATRRRIVLSPGRDEHFPRHTAAFVRSGCEQQRPNRNPRVGPGTSAGDITLAFRI